MDSWLYGFLNNCLLVGALLGSFPCFARDYNFTPANTHGHHDAFAGWLIARLEIEADGVTVSLNNNQSNTVHLSHALDVNLANLQGAQFGGNGWDFANFEPIPVGISTVTFAPNHVYRITKEQQQLPQGRKGPRPDKGKRRERSLDQKSSSSGSDLDPAGGSISNVPIIVTKK